MIKAVTELVRRNGVTYFNDVLTVLFTEKNYKQFVTSVIGFIVIYKNRYLIAQSVDLSVIIKLLKHQSLQIIEKENHNIIKENLPELIELSPPEFHMCLLKLLISNESHINLTQLMFESIAKNISRTLIANIVDTLYVECSTLICLLKVYDGDDLSNIQSQIENTFSLTNVLANAKEENIMGSLNQDNPKSDIRSSARIFIDKVKDNLDGKPTPKELNHYVIPYCAGRWKFLGDMLNIPPYTIEVIEKDHHGVEDCCRTLLHTWLQNNVDVSWKTLLSALKSPPIQFDVTGHLSDAHFSLSSSLRNYRNILRSVYTKRGILINEDWPPTLHSHFVDLPLAKVPKEISKPKFNSSFLFRHEKRDYEVEYLNSYEQIFKRQDNGHHQVIVIEGNPGSGKTTLSYKICKDWADGLILKHISLIILVILRDSRIASVKTLGDIIRLGLDSRIQSAEQICDDLITFNGKNVIIWLEGWDELLYSKRSNTDFADLISCNKLPEAIIVITTRPSAYESIQQNVITQKIEILQFTEELFNKYIDFSFCETPSHKIKFKQEINRVPSVSSLLYNPMCLVIFLHVFRMSENYTLPETLTKIYEKFLLISLRRHNIKANNDNTTFRDIHRLPVKRMEMLYSLGKLAYEELHNDELIFSYKTVSNIIFGGQDVPLDFDGMCLLEVHDVELDVGIDRNYSFLHKSIQELLAAVYLTHLENIQQEEQMRRIFGNMKLEMVWIFCAGLTTTNFRKMCVKNVFPSVSYMTNADSKSLETFASYKNFDAIFYSCEEYFYSLHLKNIISSDFFITLILCCYEAQCSELCDHICGCFYQGNVCHVYIPHSANTHHTMIALSYFVAHSKRNCALECLSAVPNGLNLLCTYLKNPTAACGRLWRLGYNCMSSGDVESLLTLVQSQCYLHSLTLPYSAFSHDDIVKLCHTLKYHETILKIDLTGCSITEKELDVISELLCVSKKIQYLALNDNPFSTLDLITFVKSLQNNEILEELRVDIKHQYKFCRDVVTEQIFYEVSSSRVVRGSRLSFCKLVIIWL